MSRLPLAPRLPPRTLACLAIAAFASSPVVSAPAGSAPVASAVWTRHAIDTSSRGADGVRLADIDRDGRLDIATGWEEGGTVRVTLQPDEPAAGQPWPGLTIGRIDSPEDALAVDLDGDGFCEIVSCHEGRTRLVALARGRPVAAGQRPQFEPLAPIVASTGNVPWMFAAAPRTQERRRRLLVASKGRGPGQVAELILPAAGLDVTQWTRRRITRAGWVMSLIAADLDGDGDDDVLVSDRHAEWAVEAAGPRLAAGFFWLEQHSDGRWTRHAIGGAGHELMFADLVPGPSPTAATTAWVITRPGHLLRFHQRPGGAWEDTTPPRLLNGDSRRTGGKAVAFAQQPGGQWWVAISRNTQAAGVRHREPGVWAASLGSASPATWNGEGEWIDVSGREGTKFDRLEWLDLDNDGDLDLLTCEERDNLGVFWYEFPD